MSLYQKMIDEAIPHTPLEAELAKQIDKQQEQISKLERIINNYSIQHTAPGPNRVVFD